MRTNVHALGWMALWVGVMTAGCAGVDAESRRSSRADDARTLRLRHLRLLTTSGYPLWLEIEIPRRGGDEQRVRLVFTTNISKRPRFVGCKSVEMVTDRQRVALTGVHYNRTPMSLQADLGTAGGSYSENGVVEDVYADLPRVALAQLLMQANLTGRVCQVTVEFEGWQIDQIRRLLRRPKQSVASLK